MIFFISSFLYLAHLFQFIRIRIQVISGFTCKLQFQPHVPVFKRSNIVSRFSARIAGRSSWRSSRNNANVWRIERQWGVTDARHGRPSERPEGILRRHVSPLEFAGLRRPLESAAVERSRVCSLRSDEFGAREWDEGAAGGRGGQTWSFAGELKPKT